MKDKSSFTAETMALQRAFESHRARPPGCSRIPTPTLPPRPARGPERRALPGRRAGDPAPLRRIGGRGPARPRSPAPAHRRRDRRLGRRDPPGRHPRRRLRQPRVPAGVARAVGPSSRSTIRRRKRPSARSSTASGSPTRRWSTSRSTSSATRSKRGSWPTASIAVSRALPLGGRDQLPHCRRGRRDARHHPGARRGRRRSCSPTCTRARSTAASTSPKRGGG